MYVSLQQFLCLNNLCKQQKTACQRSYSGTPILSVVEVWSMSFVSCCWEKSEIEPQATQVCLQCDLCRNSATAFKTQVLKTLAELQEHVKYVSQAGVFVYEVCQGMGIPCNKKNFQTEWDRVAKHISSVKFSETWKK